MKALEFEATLGTDANPKVPEDLAAQVPKEGPVRVIVLVPENAEESDWRQLTREQLLRGYSESDSIYDAL